MLTVIRELAEEAEAATGARASRELLAALVEHGEEAVARTPEQLDVLREAGVVDAGGAGLVEIVRGLAAAAAGEEPFPSAPPPSSSRSRRSTRSSRSSATARSSWSRARVSTRRRSSASSSSSATRCSSSATRPRSRCTSTPTTPARRSRSARALGTIEAVEIADMHAQTEEREERLLAARARRRVTLGGRRGRRRRGQPAPVREPRRGADRRGRPDDEPVRRPTCSRAIDATRRGRGRPAAEQLERGHDRRAGGAARRASPSTSCPTDSIPAGLAALVAFDGERSAEENAADDARGARRRSPPARSRSPRATPRPNGVAGARRASSSALVDGEAVAAGADFDEVARALSSSACWPSRATCSRC